MIHVLAGAFGFLGGLVAVDLAAQALLDKPLRPLAGTCPACGVHRGWLGWRCPSCGRPARREVWVVAVTTAVSVVFAVGLGPRWSLIPYLLFVVLSTALCLTDLDAMRIVDRLNLRGTVLLVVALGLASLGDGAVGSFWRSLLCGLAYFAGSNLVFFLARGRGFGYGDVKLSVQLGVYTGFLSWGTLGWSVFLTALIGGLISMVVLAVGLARSRARRGTEQEVSVRDAMRAELPYGPSMISGAWIAIALAGLGAFPLPT